MAAERLPARTFRDLLVWQKAHRFVLAIYQFTRNFPRRETFGLALQARRSAVSIAANIAEGFARRSKPEKALSEHRPGLVWRNARYDLILAQDLGYGDIRELINSADEVSRLLNAYTRTILAPDFLLLYPAGDIKGEALAQLEAYIFMPLLGSLSGCRIADRHR